MTNEIRKPFIVKWYDNSGACSLPFKTLDHACDFIVHDLPKLKKATFEYVMDKRTGRRIDVSDKI